MSANSYFRASMRLWSDTEPLQPVLRAIGWDWPKATVKGQSVPAKGRMKLRIASRHYASSEDPRYENIEDIVPIVADWLDKVEQEATPITALAATGQIEATLWIAIFGDGEIATPALPHGLEARARTAGVQILLENYTTPNPEDGNSAKTFLGARR